MAYSLKEINDAVRSDPKGFAEACDAAFAKKVETAAQKIADHRKESRIILLSGPSGSGKTTTALKIEEQLEKMGIQTHTISMDNYFNTIDPETAPRNREGAIDYESPFCLDIELLNRHFSMLDRGETIHVPKYEPDIYLEAAKRLSLTAGECMVFEDAPYAGVTAKKAGFALCGMAEPAYAEGEDTLRQVSDVFVEHSFAELADKL